MLVDTCQYDSYLLLLSLRSALDTIATLDHVGLEAYRPRCAVEL